MLSEIRPSAATEDESKHPEDVSPAMRLPGISAWLFGLPLSPLETKCFCLRTLSVENSLHRHRRGSILGDASTRAHPANRARTRSAWQVMKRSRYVRLV